MIAQLTTPVIGKKEGDISSVFASLSGEVEVPLPDTFRVLKHDLIRNTEPAVLEASWKSLIASLAKEVEELKLLKEKTIPYIDFKDLQSGSIPASHTSTVSGRTVSTIDLIKQRGVVVVRNVFPKDEALLMKADIRDYIAKNGDKTKGFPQKDPQVYELYWSPSQIKARADPRMLLAQRALGSLWTLPTENDVAQLTYADRLRIRTPGDKSFALGPHVDGGSLERWADNQYSLTYRNILAGRWPEYDPFDATGRISAVSDLYESPGGCAVFRQFQGWLSLSSCSPGEGTLKVNPMLRSATAYLMLRPYFSPDPADPDNLDGWKFDVSTSKFHGAAPGRGQEFTDALHPHLQLQHSMVSAPPVKPGDFLVWHCDTIHAVDSVHGGKTDASVIYIPVVPQSELNAKYIRKQLNSFLRGHPAPDFPGGKGESEHVGRATVVDIKRIGGRAALAAMGL